LRLKDGETQILAGLISDEERSNANKVPGIGELPVLSRLFGSQKDDTQRSEILLAITPRVVRSIRRPDFLAAEFESGTGSSMGTYALRLSTVDVSSAENKDTSLGKEKPTAPSPQTNPNRIAAAAPLGSATPMPETAHLAAPPSPGSDSHISSPPTGETKLFWQAPAQVRSGEQFSAVLRVSSQAVLRGLPLMVGFDPQLLQVVSVQEGDFFRQANGQTQFSHRIDPAQGKVFVAVVRQSAYGADVGINGRGAVVTVAFKALKASPVAKVQLLSASPEPSPAYPFAMPVEQAIRVVP
jgi:general secretion pathway protein D